MSDRDTGPEAGGKGTVEGLKGKVKEAAGALTGKDELQREFYAEMCRLERWSVRTLEKKIGGMLFERTALSKKPTGYEPHDKLACSTVLQLVYVKRH